MTSAAKWLRAAAFSLAGVLPAAALADDWVPIDPDNTLYIELAHGLAIIELQPAIAPKHVARIKQLTRTGFYDGLTFHRVIDGFMAQGGDPAGTGEGGSKEPNLQPEFTFHRSSEAPTFAVSAEAEAIGVSGSAIVLTEPEAAQYSHPDGLLESWIPYCRGTVAAARTDKPDTANSQFFIMFSNDYRTLDRNYTAWGHVVYGKGRRRQDHPRRAAEEPDKIIRARIGSDVPPAERKQLEEMAPGSKALRDLFQTASAASNGQLDPCTVNIPVRLKPEAN